MLTARWRFFHPGDLRSTDKLREHSWQEYALLLLLCGFFYGAVMGAFGGIAGDRFWQLIYSGTKVPLLLAATFALSLPSFFVLNTLLGARDDFAEVLRALLVAQAGVTLILVVLAPYTALWYASSGDYDLAVLFNGAMFAVASVGGQFILRYHYQPLIARNPRHRILLRFWLVIYIFVGIQMGWVLRPFVGHPEMPVQFFRADAWGNAYIAVFEKFRNLIP
jgi:hypothetical protein